MEAETSYKGGVWKHCWACRDGIRKGHSWTRDEISNRNWIQQKDHYVTSKKWNEENVGPQWNRVGGLRPADKIHMEVPDAFSASAWRRTATVPQALRLSRLWKGEELRAAQEDQGLHEREISSHPWDGMGCTQACWEPSDLQIQKDGWVVDPKLTGNIKCGYSSWVRAPQRVGGSQPHQRVRALPSSASGTWIWTMAGMKRGKPAGPAPERGVPSTGKGDAQSRSWTSLCTFQISRQSLLAHLRTLCASVFGRTKIKTKENGQVFWNVRAHYYSEGCVSDPGLGGGWWREGRRGRRRKGGRKTVKKWSIFYCLGVLYLFIHLFIGFGGLCCFVFL